jgi:hypothetical protein
MANAAAQHTPVSLSDNVKLWAFYLSIACTVAAVCGAWVTINGKVERNSTRIENQDSEMKKMDGKLDRIIDKLDVIEIKVENKQDRRR